MGELLPFKKPTNHEFRSAIINIKQSTLMDFLEGEKVRSGTHDGHAIYDSNGELLRIIATAKDEVLSDGTIEALVNQYSTPDNLAIYEPNPDPVIVKAHQLELVISLS